MPYHPPEVHAELLRDAVEGSSGLARIEEVGRSVLGRPIEAVTIGEGGRDTAFVLANVHGVEVIAAELALRLVQDLCAGRTAGARDLLEAADVVVVPSANPDGRAEAFASLDRPGLVVNAPRRNANGVDLNRNWPPPAGASDHWLPIAGTKARWLPWHRGPAPLSEPETQAVHALAHRVRPFALLNLHSTGQILTHPWSSRPEPPDDLPGFEAMIEAFTGAQKRWRYRSKQSRAWYPILGSSNDHFYDDLGTLAIAVEIARPGAAVREDPRRAGRFFWYANPLDPDAHVDNDAEGCFAAFLAAHDHRRR